MINAKRFTHIDALDRLTETSHYKQLAQKHRDLLEGAFAVKCFGLAQLVPAQFKDESITASSNDESTARR
jgi:hypothetical protein